MLTKPRTILVLSGIFLAGAASGVFLAPLLHRSGGHDRRTMQAFHERNMERLERVLSLTPEQRAQVDKLMRDTGQELAKQRRESWVGSTRKIEELNAKIEAVLNPEQRKQFEVFRKQQQERFHRRMQERDQRLGPHRPGDAPPPPVGMEPGAGMPPPEGMPPGELPPPPPE